MPGQFNRDSLDSTLSRIETTQLEIGRKLDEILIRINDQDKRLKALENWRYWVIGVGVVVTFMLHAAWEWVTARK